MVLEESHCNEKQRSSINTTTCSAGIISYLLLNGLIGSEVEKKRSGKTFSSAAVVEQNCFPERILCTVRFCFVGALVDYKTNVNGEYQYHFSAESLRSHPENEHCLISSSKSVYK